MTTTVRVINDGPGDLVLRRVNARGEPTAELPVVVTAGNIGREFDLGGGMMLRVADRTDDKLEA